jgi:hypothetical protein
MKYLLEKNMNKLIVISIFLFITAISFSGCIEIDERDKFIGFWETSSEFWPYQISFSEDICRFYYKNESNGSVNTFSYEILENNIVYLYTDPGEFMQTINLTLNYSFSENNNILTLLNPRVIDYNDSNYIGTYHKKD